jgi:hypothetical protein
LRKKLYRAAPSSYPEYLNFSGRCQHSTHILDLLSLYVAQINSRSSDASQGWTIVTSGTHLPRGLCASDNIYTPFQRRKFTPPKRSSGVMFPSLPVDMSLLMMLSGGSHSLTHTLPARKNLTSNRRTVGYVRTSARSTPHNCLFNRCGNRRCSFRFEVGSCSWFKNYSSLHVTHARCYRGIGGQSGFYREGSHEVSITPIDHLSFVDTYILLQDLGEVGWREARAYYRRLSLILQW